MAVGVINFNGGTVKALAANAAFFAIDDVTKGSLTLNVQKNATTGLGGDRPERLRHRHWFDLRAPFDRRSSGNRRRLDRNRQQHRNSGFAHLDCANLPGDTNVLAGSLTAPSITTPDATVYVADGSTLTAGSIVADTLTIGSGGFAAVPEPGTFVLLALAAIGALQYSVGSKL